MAFLSTSYYVAYELRIGDIKCMMHSKVVSLYQKAVVFMLANRNISLFVVWRRNGGNSGNFLVAQFG